MTEGRLGLKAFSLNVGATFLRHAVSAVLALVTMALIARVYGPEGTGTYSVALLLPTMLTTFLNLGVAPANAYFLGSGQIDGKTLLRANLRIASWVISVGTAAGGAIVASVSDKMFPGVPTTMLWVALAIFPLGLLGSYVLSFFQGFQRFRPFNLLLVGQPLLFLLLLVLLHLSGGHGLHVPVVAYGSSQLLTLLLGAILMRPLVARYEPTMHRQAPVARRVLSYGAKAHLSNILAFVNYRADVFIANLYLGPAAVGMYAIAVSLAERLWMVSQAVGTVLLPKLSELAGDDAARKQLTPVVTRWVLITTVLGSLVVAAIGGPFIRAIFGVEFSGAFAPLLVLLPGVVAGSGARVLANDIAARGHPERNLYTSVAVVVLNIALNFVLIPPFGLVGAAAATTIAYSLNLWLRLLVYGRMSQNQWAESVFLKRSDLRSVLSMVRKRD